MSLTHTDIAEILKLIDASTLDEVVIEVGDVKVEVRRRGAATASFQSAEPVPLSVSSGPPASGPPASGPPASGPPASGTVTPVTAPQPAGTPEQVTIAESQDAVRSPMVGTFYRRASPEQPPFVEVGSEVTTDSPLCMVEVMKLYTTIYAKRPGRVAQICAQDAELVEYDQVLFVIDPA